MFFWSVKSCTNQCLGQVGGGTLVPPRQCWWVWWEVWAQLHHTPQEMAEALTQPENKSFFLLRTSLTQDNMLKYNFFSSSIIFQTNENLGSKMPHPPQLCWGSEIYWVFKGRNILFTFPLLHQRYTAVRKAHALPSVTWTELPGFVKVCFESDYVSSPGALHWMINCKWLYEAEVPWWLAELLEHSRGLLSSRIIKFLRNYEQGWTMRVKRNGSL